MKYLVFIGLISMGCEHKCWKWNIQPLVEDRKACYRPTTWQMNECFKSLGYYEVEVPCND